MNLLKSTLLGVIVTLLLGGCKKVDEPAGPDIFGTYRVIRSSYSNSGQNSSSSVLDSNAIVTVEEVAIGEIRFVSLSKVYKLYTEPPYCGDYINCYSDWFDEPQQNGPMRIRFTFINDTATIDADAVTSFYGSGTSGLRWKGTKIP